MKKIRKLFRKGKAGDKAVSAVIGVILMVAVTIAIAATVYMYAMSMTQSSGDPMPSIAIVKYSDSKLIVNYCKEDLEWADSEDITVNIEGNASNVTMPSATIVKAGQVLRVGNEVDSITIIVRGYMIGTYDF